MSRDCWVTLPCGAAGLSVQFVIVAFPDHTHLLFLPAFRSIHEYVRFTNEQTDRFL